MYEKSIRNVGYHEADARSLLSTPRRLDSHLICLPEPPFMVPAVVEDLRSPQDTSFTGVVHLVAGEADKYCAWHGLRTGATVLSNDSDLIVFDMGENGSILLLDSLYLNPGEDADGFEISGSVLRPNEIVANLRVDSLLRLAFERFKDPYISFNNVVARAILPLKSQNEATFSTFAREYSLEDVNLIRTVSSVSLDLDTRLSELYHQLHESQQHPQIYLPILIENHARTSSWTFGLPLRLLAYSLLTIHSHRPTTTVEEHSRSGSRIRPRQLELYTSPTLSSILTTTMHHLRRTRSLLSPMIPAETPSLWHLISTTYLLESLKRIQKPLPDKEWLIEFLRDGYLTLDAVHFEANIHAVWYSLRILKQVVSLVGRRQGTCGMKVVSELEAEMDDMPGLCEGLVSRLVGMAASSNSPEGRRGIARAVDAMYNSVEGEEMD